MSFEQLLYMQDLWSAVHFSQSGGSKILHPDFSVKVYRCRDPCYKVGHRLFLNHVLHLRIGTLLRTRTKIIVGPFQKNNLLCMLCLYGCNLIKLLDLTLHFFMHVKCFRSSPGRINNWQWCWGVMTRVKARHLSILRRASVWSIWTRFVYLVYPSTEINKRVSRNKW